MLRLIDGFGYPNPVLAKTDRQLAVTHVFSSVGFGRPTAMLAKTSRHIEYIFLSVGIWDTTAMLAETDGPFVMTNAMLAKSDRQAEPL